MVHINFGNKPKGRLGIPFELIGFNNEEINLIIEQLENEPKVGKLSNSLKGLLIENSQGYPWLIKKLCIHIFNEIVYLKQKVSTLSKSNLNINNPFKKDIDELSGLMLNLMCNFFAFSGKNHAKICLHDFNHLGEPKLALQQKQNKMLIYLTY